MLYCCVCCCSCVAAAVVVVTGGAYSCCSMGQKAVILYNDKFKQHSETSKSQFAFACLFVCLLACWPAAAASCCCLSRRRRRRRRRSCSCSY